MYCIKCERDNCKPVDNHGDVSTNLEEELDCLYYEGPKMQNGYNRSINNLNVHGGIIQTMESGYGSNYDGTIIILAICDDCLESALDKATILYKDDCMFADKEFIKNQYVEPCKLRYIRRKNLDNLLNYENGK